MFELCFRIYDVVLSVSRDFMADTIIKYALNLVTEDIVFIDNADRKFYRCQECQKELTPVKGEARKREWHFRHQVDSDCKGGQETFVHQYAKQVIVARLQMAIPKYGKIDYTEAVAEKELISIRPDVTAIYNREEIYFEIAVKHFVEPSKKSVFINGKHKSIEIDLSELPLTASPTEIENAVLNEVKNKRIIFWELPPAIVYKTREDKERSWKHPIAIFGYITMGLFLIYEGYKWLTKKKRS